MRHILVFCAMCIANLFAQLAHAQNINDYVSVGASDSWINVQTFTSFQDISESKRTTEYLLVDRQRRFGEKDRVLYSRFVEQMVTSGGVEDNSTIEIVFDPAYETIKIHHIDVIRGGEAMDRLNLSSIDIFRVETDRDKLIYNGDLQLSYVVPDIQIGDVIDYAYTRYGKNPAFGPHFATSFQHQYGPPVKHLHQRALVEDGIQVSMRQHSDAPTAEMSKLDGYQQYSWSFKNRKGETTDSDAPEWYYSYPVTELSSFASWEEVGKYLVPYYETPSEISGDLEAAIEQIQSGNTSAEKKVRGALDYVQREIRYLGIELGEGGYIPRDPSDVLSRRFGDCKDMTLLLTTMLNRMDIEATPLLVDFDLKGKVDTLVPTMSAFDHVIVHAKVDGKSYFLDPTKGEQMGDLNHLQQGNFGKGVEISIDSPGVVNAEETQPPYWKVFTDTYDLVSDLDAIGFVSVSEYYMAQADSTRSWIERDGLAAVEKKYLEYYQNRFPTIEQVKDFEVEKFVNDGRLKITATYKIPKAWDVDEETGEKSQEFYPNDLIADFPKFVGAKRTSPYTFAHPIRTKQTLNFIIDDTWSFDDGKTERSFSAFDFSKTQTATPKMYSEAYRFVTKTDHITVDEFAETMAGIDEIDDILGVSLSQNPGGDAELTDEDYLWGIVFLWFLVGGIASLIIAITRRNADQEWQDKLVLYPVSMPKFIILSILTVGVYQLFWIYKNWAWFKQVEGQELSPFWRTFFSPIMNFSLFDKIKNTEPSGYSWFKIAALPLALAYLLLTIWGSLSETLGFVAPWAEWLGMAGILVLVPVAQQVLKMNVGRDEYIALNSKFDGHVLGLILGLLPLFGFMIYFLVFGFE